MRENRTESIIVECYASGRIGVHITYARRYRTVYRWHANITRASYARIARLRRSGILSDHVSWIDGAKHHAYLAPVLTCIECGNPLYWQEIPIGVCSRCQHDQNEIWIARHLVGLSLLPDDQKEYYAALLDGEE